MKINLAPIPQNTGTHPDRRYALSPSVIRVPVEDGSARLLDMDGNFYAISDTSNQMLSAILTSGPAAAARQTADTYGIDLCRTRTDVDAFLLELEKQRLVTSSVKNHELQLRAFFDSLLLGSALRLIHRLGSWRARASALLLFSRLAVRSVGWPRTVAALGDFCGQRRKTPKQWQEQHSDELKEIAQTVNDSLSEASALQPFKVNCKERALCCWALTRSAGLPATLVVGISLVPLSAHCWCELGPWLLGDDRDFCKQYLPVAHYA